MIERERERELNIGSRMGDHLIRCTLRLVAVNAVPVIISLALFLFGCTSRGHFAYSLLSSTL